MFATILSSVLVYCSCYLCW